MSSTTPRACVTQPGLGICPTLETHWPGHSDPCRVQGWPLSPPCRPDIEGHRHGLGRRLRFWCRPRTWPAEQAGRVLASQGCGGRDPPRGRDGSQDLHQEWLRLGEMSRGGDRVDPPGIARLADTAPVPPSRELRCPPALGTWLCPNTTGLKSGIRQVMPGSLVSTQEPKAAPCQSGRGAVQALGTVLGLLCSWAPPTPQLPHQGHCWAGSSLE